MAEFTKERSGKQKPPILVLPRGRGQYGPKVLRVFVVLGKKPAGCIACNIPIPAGASRLQMEVSFPASWVRELARDERETIETQSFYLHPGCLTDRIKPEVIRFALDCYDCGALPPKNDEGLDQRHIHRCFTVSKFAPAHLCSTCARKPRWRACSICSVYFPQWMISRVTGQPDQPPPPPPELDPFGEFQAVIVNGADACVHCAQRHRLVTEEEAAEARSEYARLRQEILEHGVFDAGDDL